MTDISNLKNKTANKGLTPQGRLTAEEWNTVVAAVEEVQDLNPFERGQGEGSVQVKDSDCVANGDYSHAEGYNSETGGNASRNTKDPGLEPSTGAYAHAEGNSTIAKGLNSHAEGVLTFAAGQHSHAEGYRTKASGPITHAEGLDTEASGNTSHAEGIKTTASGDYSHAEGRGVDGTANILCYLGQSQTEVGWYALYKKTTGTALKRKSAWKSIIYNDIEYTITDDVEGNDKLFKLNPIPDIISGRVLVTLKVQTGALGESSHVEGLGTVTYIEGSHAEGKYNQTSLDALHTVGCGENSNNRKNAHLITVDGKHYIPGIGGYEGTEDSLDGKEDLATVINNSNSPFKIGDGNNSAVQKGSNNTAYGENSVSEGKSVTSAADNNITINTPDSQIQTIWEAAGDNKFSLAKGEASHIEGTNNLALGKNSHAEGNGTLAGNNSAHSEGTGSKATGKYSHAEGLETEASGNQSHSEGKYTIASESSTHAEGQATNANTAAAHAEGINTIAGNGTRPTADSDTTVGKYAHAEGNGTQASGNSSHSEGKHTLASGEVSHAEGMDNIASGKRSHAEGMGTQAKGNQAHAEGNDTVANAWASHTEGYNCETGGSYTSNTKTIDTDNNPGDVAHAEGNATIAKGPSSHSEGIKTFASGKASHAEGSETNALNRSSHAEGENTKASGSCSHAEGKNTEASGMISHAEGYYSAASGQYSHAEGFMSAASGQYSHAEGNGTTAKNHSEHAEGQNNVSHTGDTIHVQTISSVGIGAASNLQKNAFEIMKNGEIYICGVGGYDGTNPSSKANSLQKVLENLGITIDWTKLGY